jgi:hypothetical protein
MNRYFQILLLCLWLMPSHAQVLSNIDLDAIQTEISNASSPYFYSTLMEKYQNNDDQLDAESYKHLYYGWYFQKEYDPFNQLLIEDTLNHYLKNKHFDTIPYLGKLILHFDPFNINVVFSVYMAYKYLKNEEKAQSWQNKYNKLIECIFKSGEGYHIEKPWIVLTFKDEYEILSALGLEMEKQETQNTLDIISVKKPNSYGISQVFFDLTLPYSKFDAEPKR